MNSNLYYWTTNPMQNQIKKPQRHVHFFHSPFSVIFFFPITDCLLGAHQPRLECFKDQLASQMWEEKRGLFLLRWGRLVFPKYSKLILFLFTLQQVFKMGKIALCTPLYTPVKGALFNLGTQGFLKWMAYWKHVSSGWLSSFSNCYSEPAGCSTHSCKLAQESPGSTPPLHPDKH